MASSKYEPVQWLDNILSAATRIRRQRAWVMIAAALTLTGAMDVISATEAWFGPAYLLVICTATWSLGWREGVLIGCLCAILAILVNGSDIYPMGAAAFPWNLLMRILAVAIMVLLIGSARRSYDREWWSARTDPLTGALNRTGFLEIVSRKDRADQWCLLGYVDLDGLKRVNDEFGHSTGDEVLKAFAQEVRKNIRETDAFARIGGDEFILYQGVGTEEEASRLAQQLHSRINAVQSRLGHLTRCSMGALIIEPDSAGVSIADIDCADRLMYKAKRQGAGLCIALRNGETAGVVTLPLAGRADRQRPQHFNHLSAA